MKNEIMKPGTIVKFKEPIEVGEEKLLFTVLENNGTRLLVEHTESVMKIKPTFVYNTSDLIEA